MAEDALPSPEHDPLCGRLERHGRRRMAAMENMRRIAARVTALRLRRLLLVGHQDVETLCQPFLRNHRHFLSITVIFFPVILMFSMTIG